MGRRINPSLIQARFVTGLRGGDYVSVHVAIVAKDAE